MMHGDWGTLTSNDGCSRPFGGRTLRHLLAEVLAKRDGWAEIRPGHWADAGAIVKAMRTAGFPTTRPKGQP